MSPILDGIRPELQDGKGFVLLRGLPFDRWSRPRSRLAAWAVGCWLGRHVCQNAQGQRIVDVTDMTAEGRSPRQYRTSQELRLHNDPASDIVGLGCLRAAKSSGESVITSAVADAQVEALDLFDRLAASPELRLSFACKPVTCCW